MDMRAIGLLAVLAACKSNASVDCGEPSGSGRGVAELEWQAVNDSRIEGYKVHRGTAPGKYAAAVDVRNRTSCRAANLHSGKTYYFAISSYGKGVESAPSQEVSKTIP